MVFGKQVFNQSIFEMSQQEPCGSHRSIGGTSRKIMGEGEDLALKTDDTVWL